MRVFLIKHKGANAWYNVHLDREFTFTDDTKILTGILFLRKKDAVSYLQTIPSPSNYEVVGATIDNKIKT